MNVNYNVIISLLTHRKFVSNEEWGILQDATEYLLQEHIEEWKKEESLKRTKERRPDMYKRYQQSKKV